MATISMFSTEWFRVIGISLGVRIKLHGFGSSHTAVFIGVKP